MRLIDADKLYNWVRRECNPYGKPTIDFESGNRMLDMIKRSSTAFDKEKVIAEMNETKNIVEAKIKKAYATRDKVSFYLNSGASDMAVEFIDVVEKGGIR